MTVNLFSGYRKMLSFFLTLLGFGSTFVFESCYGPIPTDYNLSASDSDIHFPAEGGSAVVEVDAPGEWEIAHVPQYVSVSPTTGDGLTRVSIEVEPNGEASDRRDTLYIQSESPTEFVILAQDGAGADEVAEVVDVEE